MTTINATQGPGGATALPIDDSTTTLEAGAEAGLPDPVTALALSGDPGAELAALAVQSGERQETVAQTARDAQEQTEVSDDNQQVAAMHQKADDIRSAGMWQGLGMAAEGGGTVAGAFFSSPKITQELQGGGKMANGGATITATHFSAAEANDDANADQARAAADQAKGAADDLHDAKKAGGDFISAALDFYREYTSAQASANSAALHRA
jgi:hypothetical protein